MLQNIFPILHFVIIKVFYIKTFNIIIAFDDVSILTNIKTEKIFFYIYLQSILTNIKTEKIFFYIYLQS